MRLHWKLMLTYILMVVLVMVFVHGYLNRSMRGFLIDHLGDSLERETRLAATLLDPEKSPSASMRDMDALADRVADLLVVRATIIDSGGQVLGDSRIGVENLPTLENYADRPEVRQAWKGQQGRSLRYSETLEQEMLYVAQVVPGVGDGRTVIRLALSLRDVEAIQSSIGTVVWMASALGLALALVLVYGASRFESRPLVEMTRGARQMAEGDLSGEVGIPAASTRELRDLGIALKEMYRQIRERIAQITTEKARLEAILDSITEGILVTGKDGRAVLVNQALLKIFASERPVVGYRPVELIRSVQVSEAIDEVLEKGEAVSQVLTLSGGPERHLDVHIAPVLQERDCIGAVAVFYEITALRRLERVRKDFVANVSHELRTPLTAIKGYAETLADGALDDRATSERFVQIMGAHADRLARLLDDLLDLSRLESEHLEVERTVCNLRRLVEASTGSVTPLARQKKIAIQLDIPEDMEVWCDPKLIEQALINLVDNALKYTPEGGEVHILARPLVEERAQGGIAVKIKDTGLGIPSEDLGRIFERFYRVDKGRSRAQGGTGLGLSIVRHIVESHGERVYVESELGKGSTFGFTLPVT